MNSLNYSCVSGRSCLRLDFAKAQSAVGSWQSEEASRKNQVVGRKKIVPMVCHHLKFLGLSFGIYLAIGVWHLESDFLHEALDT